MLSKYESYSKDSKKIVASLLLSMKKCVESDGASMSIFGRIGEDKQISSSMMDLIARHYNSFVPKDNYFIPSQSTIAPGKKLLLSTSKNRKNSTRELKIQN